MVTIKTKDVGEVKTRYNRSVGYKWMSQDGIQKHIKQNLGIRE